jgi:hypothetical protein
MVYLQTTYELCFGEAYFEYFESCEFSHENTYIDVSVFMFVKKKVKTQQQNQSCVKIVKLPYR